MLWSLNGSQQAYILLFEGMISEFTTINYNYLMGFRGGESVIALLTISLTLERSDNRAHSSQRNNVLTRFKHPGFYSKPTEQVMT